VLLGDMEVEDARREIWIALRDQLGLPDQPPAAAVRPALVLP
jgi:hypothetical protein